MTLTTFRGAFAQAIRDQDARTVGRMVEALRFQRRANYAECFALAHELTGIAEGEWDELLYEADQHSCCHEHNEFHLRTAAQAV